MYLFQISNYDDPAVDRETAELLHRHLEAESWRRCPAMWNAIDRIRTHAAKGPAREKRTVRCRIYDSSSQTTSHRCNDSKALFIRV